MRTNKAYEASRRIRSKCSVGVRSDVGMLRSAARLRARLELETRLETRLHIRDSMHEVASHGMVPFNPITPIETVIATRARALSSCIKVSRIQGRGIPGVISDSSS